MVKRLAQSFFSVLSLGILVFMVGIYRNQWNSPRHARGVESNKLPLKEKAAFRSTNSPKAKKNDPILILYWSKYFGNPVICDQPIPRSKICNNTNLKHCSTPCEITANRSRADNASIMIISARDPYPLPPAKFNDTPLVLFTWENPVYTPMISNAKFVSKFNYLMSYRPDLADFFLPTMDTPSVEPKPKPFLNKTGLIAAVFSHCESARTAYLKELMKHLPVDSYGDCLRNKKGLQERYKGSFKQAKINMLRNYKFTIVFHNQDCDYFVDDQMTHALNAGTIPVYMGSDKVDELLGGNLHQAIIKVRDFASPKTLADYILMVSKNETLYNTYLKWKYQGFQFSKSFLASPQGKAMQFIKHPQYCELCETIAAGRKTGIFKKKGAIKPEYCQSRKVEDWLHNLEPTVAKKTIKKTFTTKHGVKI